jgi:hypothetical protein
LSFVCYFYYHISSSWRVSSEQYGAEEALNATAAILSRPVVTKTKSADDLLREQQEDREVEALVRDLSSCALSAINRAGVVYIVYLLQFQVTVEPESSPSSHPNPLYYLNQSHHFLRVHVIII